MKLVKIYVKFLMLKAKRFRILQMFINRRVELVLSGDYLPLGNVLHRSCWNIGTSHWIGSSGSSINPVFSIPSC